MATQPALLSMEEYLHTSYHPDVDFVDGVLEERHLGEFDHGRLQGLLFAYFNSNRRSFGLTPVVEQRIRVSSDRVRICDVVLIRADAPREAVMQIPPAVCIEVLSPEDRLQRAQVMLADYLQMGVQKHLVTGSSASSDIHLRSSRTSTRSCSSASDRYRDQSGRRCPLLRN